VTENQQANSHHCQSAGLEIEGAQTSAVHS